MCYQLWTRCQWVIRPGCVWCGWLWGGGGGAASQSCPEHWGVGDCRAGRGKSSLLSHITVTHYVLDKRFIINKYALDLKTGNVFHILIIINIYNPLTIISNHPSIDQPLTAFYTWIDLQIGTGSHLNPYCLH